MASPTHHPISAVSRVCRTVAVAFLAGFCRRFGFCEIEEKLLALPRTQRVAIIASTLVLLLGCSFLAAQFGLIGMAIFLAAVFFIIG